MINFGKYKGITCDSRKAEKDFIFVAIPGVNDDGAKYINDAVANGAKAVVAVSSDDVTLPAGVAFIKSDNPRYDYAMLASEFFGNPSSHLNLFGITGTNGKTTTAGILRDIINHAATQGFISGKCGLLSTVEYSWPGHKEEASRTTPDAAKINKSLRSMLNSGCRSAVMEVSSHALSQERVAGLIYKAAAFTNLSQDHFDYHTGFEDYYLCKRKLFEQMAKHNKDGRAVVNIDDKYGVRLCKELKEMGISVLSYSSENNSADIFADSINLSADHSSFILRVSGENYPVKTGLIGRYNISNILCAIGLATTIIPDITVIADAISHSAPRWGRLEKFTSPGGAQIFVDYAHSPDAIEKTLSVLRELTTGSLTIVFGCGGDRDKSKRPLMAEAAAALADKVIITSDNPRTENPEMILDDVEAGFTGFTTPYRRIADRKTAIEEAIRSSQNGDIILIAGKGHEDYQEINGKHYHFDDREIVRSVNSGSRSPDASF